MAWFSKKVALVLSGGGARGMAHIGVIEELEKRGYQIHSIAGTSMGALVGGVYALGKMSEFKEWLYSLDKYKVFNLFDFTFSMQGFIKGDKVLQEIKNFIPAKNIEDLEISYCAVAADIINQKEVVIKEGNIYNAIRASMSIPTVFTPVKTNDGLLVDGGVINNVPINRVQRNFGDTLVAVDINANIPVKKYFTEKKEINEEPNRFFNTITNWQKQTGFEIPFQDTFTSWGKTVSNSLNNFFDSRDEKEKQGSLSYLDILDSSIDIMTSQISQLTLQAEHPDVLIQISNKACGTFDFYKAQEVIENGRRATAEILDN